MADGKIDQLIINSPFEEPEYYWDYNPETRRFTKKEGRRRAGYLSHPIPPGHSMTPVTSSRSRLSTPSARE